MKELLLILIILVIGFGLPNLLWLTNSTLKISNDSDKILSTIKVYVDEKKVKPDDLKPGESRFVFLPKSGESTVIISYFSDGKSETICHEYVEDGMYHVEAKVSGANKNCKVSLPIFSELLLLKLF